MATIRLDGICKRFAEVQALDKVSLEIESGEFFTLLGPSGCGKTTLLRTLAGFEQPDAGSVAVGGKHLDGVPPHRRNIGMVFQNYAVFPHLTVAENVAFGLHSRGVTAAEVRPRVEQMLERVRLAGLGERTPDQLSGGQQQRVGLARALVISPELLLMDEPLSNLDAKLRVEMREEIRDLQQKLGITTLYVTHDQEEALAVSDRIAVMNAGRVNQVGTPAEVYHRPSNRFVATFVGHMNLLPASALPAVAAVRSAPATALIGVRPEDVQISRAGASEDQGASLLQGATLSSMFTGSLVSYRVDCEGGLQLLVEKHRPDSEALLPTGTAVTLKVTAGVVHLFDPDSGARL